MSEPSDRPPGDSTPTRRASWPVSKASPDDARPMSYDANMQLILRRLADEQRPTGWKKWWKPRP